MDTQRVIEKIQSHIDHMNDLLSGGFRLDAAFLRARRALYAYAPELSAEKYKELSLEIDLAFQIDVAERYRAAEAGYTLGDV